MLKIIISDYMSSGGDGFNEYFSKVDAKQFPYTAFTYPDGSQMNLRNMVTEFFKSSNSTTCPFTTDSNVKAYDNMELVKTNLIKRIYTDTDVPDLDKISQDDLHNSSCIATQRRLAEQLMNDVCYY